MNFTTPHAQDMALVVAKIEDLGFEPVAIIASDRERSFASGGACGFRWLDRGNGSEPSWSTWEWRIDDGVAMLHTGDYDFTDRGIAIEDAVKRGTR